MEERKPRKKHYVEFEEGLITFETAKLAKEKHCNVNTVMVYDGQGDLTLDIGVNNEDIGMDNEAYPVYTQSVLQKWLREVHNVQIVVFPRQKNYEVYEYTYDSTVYSSLVEVDSSDDLEFNTYEEALEDGLYFALNLIKS